MSRGEKCSSGRMRSSTRFTYFFLYRLIKKEKAVPMSFCEGRESSLFLPDFSLLLYFLSANKNVKTFLRIIYLYIILFLGGGGGGGGGC